MQRGERVDSCIDSSRYYECNFGTNEVHSANVEIGYGGFAP